VKRRAPSRTERAPFFPCRRFESSHVSRLERVIREYIARAEHDKVQILLDQLCNDFAFAVHQPHARNGGLIGLAAAAIALGPVC
jgi:hypothetical protein